MTGLTIQAKVHYLGGFPGSPTPQKRCTLTVSTNALSCPQVGMNLPLACIESADIQSPPAAAADYRLSPTIGLFGGARAQKSRTAEMQAAKARELLVVATDSNGRRHRIHFGSIEVTSRDRAETRADFAADDWNGAIRLRNVLVAAISMAPAAADEIPVEVVSFAESSSDTDVGLCDRCGNHNGAAHVCLRCGVDLG